MTVSKELIPTEAQEQIKFATWLSKRGVKFSASANGGSRNYIEAAKFKRMGVSAGFPDIEIPLPVKPYHGLYIEIKRLKGGRVSDLQKEWLDYLNKHGYCAMVAYGCEEAKDIFLKYINFELL